MKTVLKGLWTVIIFVVPFVCMMSYLVGAVSAQHAGNYDKAAYEMACAAFMAVFLLGNLQEVRLTKLAELVEGLYESEEEEEEE